MKTINMICPKGHKADYTVDDLYHKTDSDGTVEEAWVVCQKCGVEFGEAQELEILITELPDYEPDPDIEYESMIE